MCVVCLAFVSSRSQHFGSCCQVLKILGHGMQMKVSLKMLSQGEHFNDIVIRLLNCNLPFQGAFTRVLSLIIPLWQTQCDYLGTHVQRVQMSPQTKPKQFMLFIASPLGLGGFCSMVAHWTA